MTAGALGNVADLGRDRDEVRDAARRIMLDPEFDHEPSLFERAMERLIEFLAERFDGGPILEAMTNEVAAWVVAGIALALLVFAVVRWTRGLGADAATLPDMADTGGRTADEWAADARAAQQRGDLDTALRYDYLAIVASLEEAGRVEPVPGRTIRELDRELARRWPDLPAGIEATGRRVEAVIFGGDAAATSDLRAAQEVLGSLQRPIGAAP